MRIIWLVIKREYLERVRKRSFLISTLLLPAMMFATIGLPAKLAMLKRGGERHIAIVASSPEFGQAVQHEIAASTDNGPMKSPYEDTARSVSLAKYKVDIDLNTSEGEQAALRAKVAAGEIDGYIWATDEAIAAGRISYRARETSDFVETTGLLRAVARANVKRRLQNRGLAADEVTRLFADLNIETFTVKSGAETKTTGGRLAFLGPVVIIMLMYMTVLLYSLAAMRAVLEDKTSRVVEVLLSSITAKQLMAGKILGICIVGVTQIAVWMAICVPLTGPAMAGGLGGIQIRVAAVIAFPVFYLLGVGLYGTMYAALGAMVSSEQEAQQWQTFLMAPLIMAIMGLMFVIRQPNSSVAVWSSMIPFLAPILMYARIVIQTPPAWQIALSVLLLLATIYGAIGLCGRIYCVGVLMYGKRPTLPEILKWIKYA